MLGGNIPKRIKQICGGSFRVLETGAGFRPDFLETGLRLILDVLGNISGRPAQICACCRSSGLGVVRSSVFIFIFGLELTFNDERRLGG